MFLSCLRHGQEPHSIFEGVALAPMGADRKASQSLRQGSIIDQKAVFLQNECLRQLYTRSFNMACFISNVYRLSISVLWSASHQNTCLLIYASFCLILFSWQCKMLTFIKLSLPIVSGIGVLHGQVYITLLIDESWLVWFLVFFSIDIWKTSNVLSYWLHLASQFLWKKVSLACVSPKLWIIQPLYLKTLAVFLVHSTLNAAVTSVNWLYRAVPRTVNEPDFSCRQTCNLEYTVSVQQHKRRPL